MPAEPPRPPDIDPGVHKLLATGGVGPLEVVATLRPPRAGTTRTRTQTRQAAAQLVTDTTNASGERPDRTVVLANLGVVVIRASPAYITELIRHELLGTLAPNHPSTT